MQEGVSRGDEYSAMGRGEAAPPPCAGLGQPGPWALLAAIIPIHLTSCRPHAQTPHATPPHTHAPTPTHPHPPTHTHAHV